MGYQRTKNSKHSRTENQLRIIGGKWRGRKLSFPNADGLRPTGDRLRETLFNWLGPYIEGANVIDLFAGSGILGFESASRLAKKITLVEKNPKVAAHLITSTKLLEASNISVSNNCAIQYLKSPPPSAFDIAFIDPPFGQNMIEPIFAALTQPGTLNHSALVYIETPISEPLPTLPRQWKIFKQKTAGNVSYQLFVVGSL